MDLARKGSKSGDVYTGLRESIINLKLMPGEEIKINLIAGNLGVSRSPVRDALMELDKEGLVDILPQIGTRVSKIDLERVHEERFLRSSLEEKTLEIFLESHAASDLADLKRALDLQKISLDEKDYASFLSLDDEFHRIFFSAANKKKCWQLIQNMSGHYRRVRFLILRSPVVRDRILAQHKQIYELIVARKNTQVMQAIKIHLSMIIEEENGLLQEFPEYFRLNDTKNYFTA